MALQDQGLVARHHLARWAYAGLLAALLLAVFTARRLGVSTVLSGEVIAFGSAAIAVAALLPLRPEPRRYASGIGLMVLSAILFWLQAPAGPLWSDDPNEPPLPRWILDWGVFGLMFTAAFSAGWLSLAWSVASVRVGVISYLAAGCAFAFYVFALSRFHPSFLPVIPSYTLFWPGILLHLLGVFGTMFG
jgi:hypothetical protein